MHSGAPSGDLPPLPRDPLSNIALIGALSAPVWSHADRSGGGIGGSPIRGKRILIVEDEFLLADEMADWLAMRGAEIMGPAPNLEEAQRIVHQAAEIDGAVLDINLAGLMVFPLALELERRRVPLLFASAYSSEIKFPEELRGKVRLNKPISEAQLISAVEKLLDPSH